eukprot:766344-Hanusia_phi.AAC.3
MPRMRLRPKPLLVCLLLASCISACDLAETCLKSACAHRQGIWEVLSRRLRGGTDAETETSAPEHGGKDEDACMCCCEPMETVALALCGHHNVCGLCCYRLRFLLNQTQCIFCQQVSDSVFIANSQNFPPQGPLDKVFWDNETKVCFENEELASRFRALSEAKCTRCGQTFETVQQLQNHTKLSHRLRYCWLCLENRKIFISEQKVYDNNQFRLHLQGRDASSLKSGHPLCRMCWHRFYDDTQLIYHMSQEHFACHICQRRREDDGGQTVEFFQSYEQLFEHFRCKHYVCEETSCMELRYIAFGTELELFSHMSSEHGKSVRRRMREAILSQAILQGDGRSDYSRGRRTAGRAGRGAQAHRQEVAERTRGTGLHGDPFRGVGARSRRFQRGVARASLRSDTSDAARLQVSSTEGSEHLIVSGINITQLRERYERELNSSRRSEGSSPTRSERFSRDEFPSLPNAQEQPGAFSGQATATAKSMSSKFFTDELTSQSRDLSHSDFPSLSSLASRDSQRGPSSQVEQEIASLLAKNTSTAPAGSSKQVVTNILMSGSMVSLKFSEQDRSWRKVASEKPIVKPNVVSRQTIGARNDHE